MSESESNSKDDVFTFQVPEHFRYSNDLGPVETWSADHIKVLYLISLYSHVSQSPEVEEKWLRDLPLKVMIFECITSGVLDFDYAPKSELVTIEGSSRRIFLNISQEGRSAVEDLRENRLLNGLKLSTEDFQPVTAFQVSLKGLECLKQLDLSQELKDEIRKVCYHEGNLLKVVYEDDDFMLTDERGFRRESNVNDTEDVSYVCSPYLPVCLRVDNESKRKPFSSYRARAHEASQGGNNVEDELDEAVVLEEVCCLIGEWIPFGSNQIVALNERLGALDRCQGGLFTAMVDKCPSDTKFKVPAGLTSVKISDYNFVRFINFEAEINYPEDDDIIQIENFGMHLNVNGSVIYGIIMDAVCERKHDDICIDYLSRVLVDIHQDSSSIMNDLLSQFQRSLLDTVYNDDSRMRNKYNCIIAEGIRPKLKATAYMDRGYYENELKQVLGDIRSSHDISEDIVLLIGKDGILLAGQGASDHEEIMSHFLSIMGLESFIRNFFVRSFVLDKTLGEIRDLVEGYESDPNSHISIQQKLNIASRTLVLLKAVLEYVFSSLETTQVPSLPEKIEGKRLFKVLDMEGMKQETKNRCEDLEKLIEAAHHQLLSLQQMADSINTKLIEDVCKNISANSKILVDASAANERSSASLEVMQVILAGSFSFDIIDRLSGGTLNIVVPKWVEDILIIPIIKYPFLFFILNMLWFLLVSKVLLTWMKRLSLDAAGHLSLRVILNKKVNLAKLRSYLTKKKIDLTESVVDSRSQKMKTTWNEDDVNLWKGSPPTIEIVYENRFGFLLEVFFQVNARKTNLREKELVQVFENILAEAGVYDESAAEEAQNEKYSPEEIHDKVKISKGHNSAKVIPIE